MTREEKIREACALVADRAAENDLEYASKYPDEAHKYESRAHRAKTIAASIRCLDGHALQMDDE